MLYNYRLLGTWPLAVTAYNHGPGGLRRAQDELGTSDIAVIVKRYQGATFGFASRNFYVAFLAALEVDRNAEKYFGPLTHLPETESTSWQLPDYIPIDALARAFKVDLGALRVLNPALRPPIWNETAASCRAATNCAYRARRRTPRSPRRGRGCRRRNATSRNATTARTESGAARRWQASRRPAASRLNRPARGQWLEQPRDGVARRDSCAFPAGIACRRLPAPCRRPRRRAGCGGEAPACAAGRGSIRARRAASKSVPPPKEPVSERQTESTALLPAAAPSGNADTTDYSVGADNTVVVQAAETLGTSPIGPSQFRIAARAQQAAQERHGDARPQGQARSLAGERRTIRGGAARLPPRLQEEFLCHPPHRRHRKLRR